MDGYRAAIEKAMQEIMSAINDGGGVSNNGENNNSPNIKSNIDQSKLNPMNLPKKENSKDNNSKSDSGFGLPSNVNQDSSDEQDSKNKDSQKRQDGQDSQNGQGGNKGDSEDNAFSNTKKTTGTIDISYDEKKDGIGKTGTFIDSEKSDKLSDSLRKTYGENLDEVLKELKKNSIINTREKVEKARKDLYNSLGSNDVIKQIWDEAKKSESKFKAMWKKVLKRFLSRATRNAGRDVKNMNDTRWFERRHMTIKTMASYHPTIGNDVQDINVYIDVSGSVRDAELLLQLIAQSLVTFLKAYNYSGINIIPWASESTGIHKVESIKSGSSKKATDEILKHINDGINQCGSGTDLNVCIDEIVETTFQYKNRKQKDDVHIIISDGETSGYENGVEDKIMKKVMEAGGNTLSSEKLAKKVVKNCIWMIYDNDSTSWDNAIQNGELVKISSKNVIPD
jgi:predicted metal-dependent peptidase